MKGGNPKVRIWDDVVTYCDLESLLKYTYINNIYQYLKDIPSLSENFSFLILGPTNILAYSRTRVLAYSRTRARCDVHLDHFST